MTRLSLDIKSNAAEKTAIKAHLQDVIPVLRIQHGLWTDMDKMKQQDTLIRSKELFLITVLSISTPFSITSHLQGVGLGGSCLSAADSVWEVTIRRKHRDTEQLTDTHTKRPFNLTVMFVEEVREPRENLFHGWLEHINNMQKEHRLGLKPATLLLLPTFYKLVTIYERITGANIITSIWVSYLLN